MVSRCNLSFAWLSLIASSFLRLRCHFFNRARPAYHHSELLGRHQGLIGETFIHLFLKVEQVTCQWAPV